MASGVVSVVNWFQRTVPWSNTRRAWLERLAFVGLISATTALVMYTADLPPWSVVVGWGVLLVLFGLLLRQGWFFVFGPVLFYDLVRSARRMRTYVIRFLYVLLLFIILCWYWLAVVELDGGRRAYGQTITETDVANYILMFFFIFVIVQMGLVILLTPAYVAGAITEEKERKTLEFILATDLRNREIVLGKFFARLLHLMMLVLAGLPILSALQFMGGIDPNLLLTGYAGTVVTMVSIAAFSMFASTVCRRSRDAIIIVYLSLLTYAVMSTIIAQMLLYLLGTSSFPSSNFWTSPVTLGDVVTNATYVFQIGNPGFAIYHAIPNGTVAASTVWGVLEEYTLFHGIATVLFLSGSMALLRRAALAQPKPKRPRTWFGLGGKRKLPAIGSFPMIWKEVFLERGFRLHILLRLLFVLLVLFSILPLFGILYDFMENRGGYGYGWSPWQQLSEEMNVYVRITGMLVAILGIMAVGIRAATSVRSEYAKDTMDAILTSPMNSEEILFGKWLGSILSARWVLVWALCIWALGVVTTGMNPVMFPLLVGAWLVYAGLIASLGLWFSVISRTSLQAILATLFVFYVMCCGHWLVWMCCLPFQFARTGPSSFNDAFRLIAEMQMGVTPHVLFALLPFRTEEFTTYGRDLHPLRLIVFAMGGTSCWGLVAWGFWRAANDRFKKATLRTIRSVPDPFRANKNRPDVLTTETQSSQRIKE